MAGEVLFVAGETSGDLHASVLATELRALHPELTLTGVGGDCMAEAGVQLFERSDRLAVMGFAEILRYVPRHIALLRDIRRRLRSGAVRLVILVDYPGFNLKVAKSAHEAGVPVLYYIAPQVWAWHESRVRTMARVIDRAAVILPFEETFFARHGVRATFVGHPLLDRAQSLPDRPTARRELGLGSDDPVLALFPGSRVQEVERMLDVFVGAARLVESRVPGLRVIVSVAPGMEVDPARCPYPLIAGKSFTVLRAASAALCKSGTTTLEAAVTGTPLIVAYRTSGWSYAIARRLVRIPYIALVNIVAGRRVAPELVQKAVTPEALAMALLPLFDEGSDERRAQVDGLAEVRARLGAPGAARRTALLAGELIA
ncbi:MAG TPA: lipid-A-disaccharide synthase [Gemmatimonadaceae bacterium]|nr:lipid-A-disaccharide synthase [Gemmatimonadaceae bacterium]